MHALLAVGLLVAGIAATPAQLGCHRDCTLSCRAETDGGIPSPECRFQGAHCRAIRDASPAARGRHGAIAYAPGSGARGWSYDQDDAATARRRALGYCAGFAEDCAIAVTFDGGCAAVAAAPGGIVTWGKAPTRAGAERDALRRCRDRTSDCSLQTSACSSR